MTKEGKRIFSEIDASCKKICEIMDKIPFALEFDMEVVGKTIWLNGVFISQKDFERFKKRFSPVITKVEGR